MLRTFYFNFKVATETPWTLDKKCDPESLYRVKLRHVCKFLSWHGLARRVVTEQGYSFRLGGCRVSKSENHSWVHQETKTSSFVLR